MSVNIIVLNCPHCEGGVTIQAKDIQCGIFRHAVFKINGEQVPPHASKEQCDAWVTQNLVWGCSRPFRFINAEKLEISDYV